MGTETQEAKAQEVKAPEAKKEEKKLTREERLEAYGKRLQSYISDLKRDLKFSEDANRILQVEITTLKGDLSELGKEKARIESALRVLESKQRSAVQEGVARGKGAFRGESARLRKELADAKNAIRSLTKQLNDPSRSSKLELESQEIAARIKVTLDKRDAEIKGYQVELARARDYIKALENHVRNPLKGPAPKKEEV